MKTNLIPINTAGCLDWLKTQGFYATQTGGGCDALQKQDGRRFWLITDLEDPSLPENMDAPCSLGLYDDADGAWIGGVTCEDVWQAVALSAMPAETIEGFEFAGKL